VGFAFGISHYQTCRSVGHSVCEENFTGSQGTLRPCDPRCASGDAIGGRKHSQRHDRHDGFRGNVAGTAGIILTQVEMEYAPYFTYAAAYVNEDSETRV